MAFSLITVLFAAMPAYAMCGVQESPEQFALTSRLSQTVPGARVGFSGAAPMDDPAQSGTSLHGLVHVYNTETGEMVDHFLIPDPIQDTIAFVWDVPRYLPEGEYNVVATLGMPVDHYVTSFEGTLPQASGSIRVTNTDTIQDLGMTISADDGTLYATITSGEKIYKGTLQWEVWPDYITFVSEPLRTTQTLKIHANSAATAEYKVPEELRSGVHHIVVTAEEHNVRDIIADGWLVDGVFMQEIPCDDLYDTWGMLLILLGILGVGVVGIGMWKGRYIREIVIGKS